MKLRNLRQRGAFAAVLIGAALVSCERNGPPRPVGEEHLPVAPGAPETDVAPQMRNGNGNGDELPAPTTTPASAVEDITQARCAREARCDNVGPDRKYASRATCLRDVRAEWREDLTAFECPGGAIQTELNQCLNAIRTQECGSVMDRLERIIECRAGAICAD